MKKIIVLTHNPVRDPVTDDCLSACLRKKGHFVFRRGFLEDDKNMILCIKPNIVIVPEIRCEYTRDFAAQCKAWGIQVVVRPCEVGISAESMATISDEYRKAIFGNWPVNELIDLMLCWGPKMKTLFSMYGGIEEHKMEAVGGLAFDQFFLPPPPETIPRTEKKRVLFATGFAYADRNPQYAIPEARPEDRLHAEMVRIDSAARARWLTAIKQFWAQRGNDWEIWVKPHPGEKEEVYRAVLKDIVTYCPPLPAVRALRYVDAVVHAGSTMAFEAHLLQKPAFCFDNICQDIIVSKISPQVETVEELIKNLDGLDPTRSNANPEIIDLLQRDYYGTCDGKASQRAAEAIDALPENHPQVPDQWPPFTGMRYKTDCILINVERWQCRACQTIYHVQGPREMVKCPCCGIANVKMNRPINS